MSQQNPSKKIDPEGMKQYMEKIMLQIQNNGHDTLPQLSPSTIEGIYLMAYQYYERSQYSQAIQYFQFLTLINPYTKKHWMGLGASLQMTKEYQKAVDAYGFAALIEQTDPYVHYHAAECFFSMKKFEQALRALNSVEKVLNKKDPIQPLVQQVKLMRKTIFKQYKKEKENG